MVERINLHQQWRKRFSDCNIRNLSKLKLVVTSNFQYYYVWQVKNCWLNQNLLRRKDHLHQVAAINPSKLHHHKHPKLMWFRNIYLRPSADTPVILLNLECFAGVNYDVIWVKFRKFFQMSNDSSVSRSVT